jgi:GT2 family glycosyltransferase
MVTSVSIIIINYNTFQLTCNCIESIYQKCKAVDFEIILVDNASDECNPNIFSEKFPAIKLISSPENVGFSKGNNLGIAVAQGEYILLLNSDTELVNDAISPCIQHLSKNKKVGVVTTKLIFPDGRIQSTCQRFPNIFYNLLELLRFQKIFPIVGGKLLLSCFFNYKEKVSIDWTWGAFFMFPKNLLQKLPNGQLNDEFFMYCEDMKWCMDIKKMGYEIHYIPNGEVIHYMGASGGAKKPLMIQNHAFFMKENFNLIHRLAINIFEKVLR